MKSATSCRRCGRWIEGEWPDADEAKRAVLLREMEQGCCDRCLPGNPHPPGSFAAACWDVTEAARQLRADVGRTWPGRALVRLTDWLAEKFPPRHLR